MPSTLNPLITGLAGAMTDRDYAAFRQRLGELGARARECGPDDLTGALGELAPMLGKLHGVFAKVAVLAGACVEWGGSPLPLRDALPDRAASAMELYRLFPAAWARGTQPPRSRTACRRPAGCTGWRWSWTTSRWWCSIARPGAASG